MKKMLLALSIGWLLCSCNPLKGEYQQVDFGCKTGVLSDEAVILYGNGDELDRTYQMPCTRDCLFPFMRRVGVRSGQPIYIYKHGDQFAASEVNLENARAIRAATSSIDLAAGMIVKNAAICLVGLIVALLLWAVAGIFRRGDYVVKLLAGILLLGAVSYVNWGSAGKMTCLKTQSPITGIMPNVIEVGGMCLAADEAAPIDMFTQKELAVGDEVTVYQYKDKYFFSTVTFGVNDLNCRSCYVHLWWMYTALVLLALLGALRLV